MIRSSRAPCRSVRDILLEGRTQNLDRKGVVEECLERIGTRPDLQAFLWCDRGRVLAQVGEPSRDPRPLEGVPIAIKDNIDSAGIPTTSGSLVDRDRIPDVDAAVWRRLRDHAGAVLVGKTQMSEFAYRSHHPALPRPRNPWQPARASGGSSSGSGVAVAAGLVPAALGTDTGGSVRIPAAYCGVVGMKGTHGAVQTEGVVPLSPSMDHVGVLADSVTDAAIVFEAMVDQPRRLVDPVSLRIQPQDPRTLRVGVAEGYLASKAQAGVVETWRRAVGRLARLGCRTTIVDTAPAAHWRAAHRTILLFEAWEMHGSRLLSGAPFGPVFRQALGQGRRIGERAYARACRVREEARERLDELFSRVDVLTTPTCPTIAPRGDEGATRLSYNRYTTLAAFAGIPAASIPGGLAAHGMPVGIQLMTAANAEHTLFSVALLLEEEALMPARPGPG